MDWALSQLQRHQYLAMFGILFLCGLGLPLPEEVTLIASGLAVGWDQADFWLASLACVTGILAGDSVIFFLGRHYGRRFLASRPMRLIMTPKRKKRVRHMFSKHGRKTVFFARFLAGVRIGVYAYAGQHGMSWGRFLYLDLLGALISGPTSIWLGKFAAEKLANPEEAAEYARKLIGEGHNVLYVLGGIVVGLMLLHWAWNRWTERRAAAKERAAEEATPESTTTVDRVSKGETGG